MHKTGYNYPKGVADKAIRALRGAGIGRFTAKRIVRGKHSLPAITTEADLARLRTTVYKRTKITPNEVTKGVIGQIRRGAQGENIKLAFWGAMARVAGRAASFATKTKAGRMITGTAGSFLAPAAANAFKSSTHGRTGKGLSRSIGLSRPSLKMPNYGTPATISSMKLPNKLLTMRNANYGI